MYKLSKQEREFRERVRGRYPPDQTWYAVMTHCGREREIGDLILFDFSDNGIEGVLLPEIKASPRRAQGKCGLPELLFSSYVFFRCKMTDDVYIRISSYDGVFQILGRAYRIPTTIEDAEMSHLKGVLATHPKPKLASRLNLGAEVVVTEGLMEGMRGRLIEIGSRYAKIETCFSFLDIGTSIVVAVPPDQIQVEHSAGFRSRRDILAGVGQPRR